MKYERQHLQSRSRGKPNLSGEKGKLGEAHIWVHENAAARVNYIKKQQRTRVRYVGTRWS